MGPLVFAFQYFTNFPLPGKPDLNENTAAASLTWLPLTGLAIGLCLAAVEIVCQNTGFPQLPHVKSILIMALELWVGGAYFIQGYCHSCDGVLSGLGRIRSLERMSESGIRPIGGLGLVFAILGKLLLLAELSLYEDFLFLLLFYPCWARWSVSFASYRYQTANDEGMAYFFKIGQKPVYIVLSSVFTLLFLIIMPQAFYMGAMVSFIAVLFCCSQVQARLGGQTEQTFGMVAVTAELAFLLCSAISEAMLRSMGG
ncbi:MAG: adenosylcobinamide-GDP ribazoletransferase [Peptococcaceae bacterium]|jgi:adenosylcobinamide-GDP ribazoletransferase|nr:adenosylcobinamide-GDP ribazoletransferase [Peptococcaceae bacterium]